MTGETRSGDEGCNRVADSAALAVGEDSSQHFFLSKRLFEGSLCIRLTCKVGMCISFPYIGFLIHVSCIGICAHGHAIPHGDLHVPAMPTARTAAHQMPQRPNADRRIETWSRSSARTPDRCSQDEHCHPLSSYAPGMPRLHSARLGRYAWVCHA